MAVRASRDSYDAKAYPSVGAGWRVSGPRSSSRAVRRTPRPLGLTAAARLMALAPACAPGRTWKSIVTTRNCNYLEFFGSERAIGPVFLSP